MANKILVYKGPLDQLGDASSNTRAVGILPKFDYVVIVNQSGGAINTMTEVLRAVKLAKPTIKIFGYTDLGNSANYTAWQTTVDTWTTNVNHPTETLIDGIFVDNFGFTFTPSTRANQNSAVNYIHGKTLSIMVNSNPVMNVFNKYTSVADAVIGTSTTIKDYVFLEGFYFDKVAMATSTSLEAKETMYGRLDYVKGAKAAGKNIGYVGVADMVNSTTVPVEAYNNIIDIATQFSMDAIGFAPADYGSTSHDYFFGKRINDFTS